LILQKFLNYKSTELWQKLRHFNVPVAASKKSVVVFFNQVSVSLMTPPPPSPSSHITPPHLHVNTYNKISNPIEYTFNCAQDSQSP
jgi:hypothetical protein